MVDNNEEEVWPVQHRLLLSNALEVMSSQHWPAISRLTRQFSLATTISDEHIGYAAKVRYSNQKLHFRLSIWLFLSIMLTTCFIGMYLTTR